MTATIQVTKRSDDYHAAASDPRVWGCGQSPQAAIGDLIMSHQDYFDIHIYQDIETEQRGKVERAR